MTKKTYYYLIEMETTKTKETTTGQAAQCKKTDWFKKIYDDMIGDEEPRSVTLPDDTRLELNTTRFDIHMSHIYNTAQTDTSSTRRVTRLTSMEDELIERIFSSNYSNIAL